jgi:outer membrane protein OmpA-like peptidoglycan-associated protein
MTATAAFAAVSLSCAGQTLLGKVTGYETILQGAIADGSKTIGCAPKETAIAEANIRFAKDALAMGEYYRGKEHVEKAEIYTTLARKKTDPVRCKDPNTVRDNAPRVGDRDGDGYDDKTDKCPDDPEDFDSFEDDDGCPDKDNDKDNVLDAAEFKDGKWTNNDKKTENGREIDCRNEPEDVDQFEDEDGCPDPDNDRDTILDGVDNCPNDPEDFDQFEDQDGCPDKDNDKDGVLDAAELNRNPDGTYAWTNKDKKTENGVEVDCRNLPEDFDKFEDEDGCPDVLKIDNCQIKLSDKIYFKFNKWDIDPKSFKVLDEVRDTLNAAPDIKIWIEGHTDSKGSDKYNKNLSQKRVDSVKKYLVEQGKIDGTRLEPVGWGEEKPIDSNKTAEGRANNRRVEFNLKDCKKTIQ